MLSLCHNLQHKYGSLIGAIWESTNGPPVTNSWKFQWIFEKLGLENSEKFHDILLFFCWKFHPHIFPAIDFLPSSVCINRPVTWTRSALASWTKMWTHLPQSLCCVLIYGSWWTSGRGHIWLGSLGLGTPNPNHGDLWDSQSQIWLASTEVVGNPPIPPPNCNGLLIAWVIVKVCLDPPRQKFPATPLPCLWNILGFWRQKFCYSYKLLQLLQL